MNRAGFSRRIVATALLIVLAGTLYGERGAVWSRLYRRAETLEDKLEILTTATANPTEDMIPMLVGALDELNVGRRQLSNTTERQLHTRLTMLAVKKIGELGVTEASDMVYDVVENADDPVLKGEAILALGRIGALDYADDVALILRNLNLNYQTRQRDRAVETIAYACVLALERFKDPAGFSPLFFASIGWYSPASGVRSKAEEVMQTLIDDPSDVLGDIVRSESDFSVKLEALEAEDQSTAPAGNKVEVAAEALRQGMIHDPRDVSQANTLSRLRLLAMEMLIEYEATSERAIPRLKELLYGSFDINERITAILVLGSMGTEEAVSVLIEFLGIQNDRQSSGVTPADYRIIRTTIAVLGQVGDDRAFEELTAVGFSDWPSSIERAAEEAIEKLEGAGE